MKERFKKFFKFLYTFSFLILFINRNIKLTYIDTRTINYN